MATNCNLASVLGLFLVFTLFHNPITVAGQHLPQVALFIFGDSNFDAGYRKYLTSASLPQNFWPYGMSRDNPTGKFSDGKIVPDFVAKMMGITHNLEPAIKPDGNFSRGASFAVDAAPIYGIPKDSLNLTAQVRKFDKMISNWKSDDIKKSVFMISIGMEDYFNFDKEHPDADLSKQQDFVSSSVNRLRNDIELLYTFGARKFVVYTLPPLGCLPIKRQEYNTGNDCYDKLNDLAKLHNAGIGPMLKDLANAKSSFQFTVFDFYDVIFQRTLYPMHYRFSVTNTSCCGTGTHNAYGCGYPNVHSNLCDYPRSYLYFDGRHNSEKAQESFAHLLFGGDPNVIQPMTIRELITFSVNANMSEFWKGPKDESLMLVNDIDVDSTASM